jgi:hypothetical protein
LAPGGGRDGGILPIINSVPIIIIIIQLILDHLHHVVHGLLPITVAITVAAAPGGDGGARVKCRGGGRYGARDGDGGGCR